MSRAFIFVVLLVLCHTCIISGYRPSTSLADTFSALVETKDRIDDLIDLQLDTSLYILREKWNQVRSVQQRIREVMVKTLTDRDYERSIRSFVQLDGDTRVFPERVPFDYADDETYLEDEFWAYVKSEGL